MDDPNFSAWLGLLSQATRFLAVDVTGTEGLLVEGFAAREAVNEPFRFVVDCVSASAMLDVAAASGKPIRVRVTTASGGTRTWHGYVTGSAFLGADGGLARYRLVMESALAFLDRRRNTLIFQDKTVLEILEQVFADHPELAWRNESAAVLRRRSLCTQYRESDLAFVTRLLGEEGLSYRFEHAQGDARGDAGHTLVIFSGQPGQGLPAGDPATVRFHRVAATERDDAITLFAEQRHIAPDEVTTASWKADQVRSLGGDAMAPARAGAPALPALDVFEADRAGRFDSADQARAWASHRLDALRQSARGFRGQGAVRTLEPGKRYTLVGHPDLDGQSFVPLVVEHRATNNLRATLAGNDGAGLLREASYRNGFFAVPADVAIAPLHADAPLAHGSETAIVTGVQDAALTGTRDHHVRVQFWWQRGVAPLAGGLTDAASASGPDGHAPGDERSGTWVRVAEANAGGDHGHSFVPRIGDEVLVEYAHGDVDQPVIVGQLYHGAAAPVLAAGEDSGVNHPGTLSGIRTQGMDGAVASTWVLDDASGQLRQSLSHAIAHSRLDAGYLIDATGSQRGGYRGEGFELTSAAWTIVRAGEGMLVSGTAHPCGQSTQMDAAAAMAQLRGAQQTAARLDAAAVQAIATPLAANPAQAGLQKAIDPMQDGRYAGRVGGQVASRPVGSQRSGGDPVERFNQPVVLLEAPARIALTSGQSTSLFAGTHQHFTVQRDAQFSAGATLAVASGDAAGLYAADGGMKAIANHGPVSIEAHAGPMQILADRDVTVTSTTARIDVLARAKIVLQAGSSSLTLEGANLTFACPGTFTVKSATHQWLDGESQAAALPALPTTSGRGSAELDPDQPSRPR